MFIVAPTGTTNDETSFLTPKSSLTVLSVTGIVAADEEVEKANKATFLIFLKNMSGFKLAKSFRSNE